MKNTLLLILIFWTQTTLAQFGMIQSPKSYVLVYSAAGNMKDVIDTLYNGQIVYGLEAEADWLPIDYADHEDYNFGYIRPQEFRYIASYTPLKPYFVGDSFAVWESDSMLLRLEIQAFDKRNIQSKYEDARDNQYGRKLLVEINGRKAWGNDGEMPEMEYKKFVYKIGSKEKDLPIQNLFNPNLGSTQVFIDKSGDRIFITAANGTGAGAYLVLWTIANGKYQGQLVTRPF